MTCGSETREFELFLAGHEPLPCAATFRAGEMFGNWRIAAFLGKGGSGEVYRAVHAEDAREAALKVHVRRPDASDARENSARERFRREARILAANAYAFFPKLFEFGESGGHLYFAIELLEPIVLPGTDGAVASFLLELCRAAGVLHRQGLVHRDIKPQNIMRRANGELVLIDLGLVKETADFARHTGNSVTIVDGKVVGAGTPRYAAPEQFNGGAVSPATDIHALGMLANECFGGRPPRAWERIIGRCTSTIPERRYADVDALAGAVRRRHGGRIAAWSLAVLAVGALLGAALCSGRRAARPPEASRSATVPAARPAWRDIAEDVVTNIVERQLLWERRSTNDFGVVTVTERALRNTTNSVAGTVLRLNNRKYKFDDPMLLETNRCYWIVGPGTLDVAIEGLPGARVWLENCVLVNRTAKSPERCGVHYVFRKGAYLNFIGQRRSGNFRAYIEDFDAACNALEFQGPESIEELLKRRDAESRGQLELEGCEVRTP